MGAAGAGLTGGLASGLVGTGTTGGAATAPVFVALGGAGGTPDGVTLGLAVDFAGAVVDERLAGDGPTGTPGVVGAVATVGAALGVVVVPTESALAAELESVVV